MEFVLVAMFGSFAALFLFSAALLGGSALVRRLRLPNDPPLDAFFSAPAPALIKHPQPELAKSQAQEHGKQQELLDQAKFLCEHALQCEQDFTALESYGNDRSEAEQKAWKQLKPIHKQLSSIPEAFEKWHKNDGLLAHQTEIEQLYKKHKNACTESSDIVKALPPPNKTRLYLLCFALIAACLLLLFVQIYIANGPITASP